MANELDPVVGNWYETLDKGDKFEIVAVDEDAGTVDIQYYDGDIEEMDIDAWYELDIELSEQPDDWNGPYDEDDEEAEDDWDEDEEDAEEDYDEDDDWH
ncbi:MAG: hypothetical protein RBT51_06030 [Ectothiorhodospiraceae bacterium]|jgi:hypothetical protein|nr:hypothetical protein [Ectothiorhodospiraceae bacterium]